MSSNKESAYGTVPRRPVRQEPFDEADWVDWDHWQTVEELQNFMNGLADISAADVAAAAERLDDGTQIDHIARQIQRHGLEVEQ